MTGSPAPRLTRLTATDREDLVAYLDGELPPEKERELDHLLGENAVARQDVKRLADVYEMLDYLPQVEVSDDFTHTTMASLPALSTPEKEDARTERLDVGSLAKTAVLSFVVTGTAFWLSHSFRKPPVEETLRAMPVLQNLEELRAVGDREFLDWLATSGTRRLLEEASG